MRRPWDIAGSRRKCFVNQPVDLPQGHAFVNLHTFAHNGIERSILPDSLAVALVDPFSRAVGGYGNQWRAAIVCLCESRPVVEHGRTRSAHKGDRL